MKYKILKVSMINYKLYYYGKENDVSSYEQGFPY